MKKIRFIASVFLTMVLFSCLMISASAEGGEPIPDVVPTPVVDVPGGTGTVIENATEEDGKEFYTIMTPDENVFYLIIDRQRNTENVYFLNAVTEADGVIAFIDIRRGIGGSVYLLGGQYVRGGTTRNEKAVFTLGHLVVKLAIGAYREIYQFFTLYLTDHHTMRL